MDSATKLSLMKALENCVNHAVYSHEFEFPIFLSVVSKNGPMLELTATSENDVSKIANSLKAGEADLILPVRVVLSSSDMTPLVAWIDSNKNTGRMHVIWSKAIEWETSLEPAARAARA
jgi:hypothetical protein